MPGTVVVTENTINVVAAEVNTDGSLTITLVEGGRYFRIPITLVEGGRYYRTLNATPVEPVEESDTLTRPSAFSDELESRYTRMVECHSVQPFGYQSFADTVEMFFIDQLCSLAPGECLTFEEANRRALERSECYPSTPAELIPAAPYHWAKVAATAWRSLKVRLGQ